MQWLPVMGKTLGNTSPGSNIKLLLNQTSLQFSESIFSELRMSKIWERRGSQLPRETAVLRLSMGPRPGNPQLSCPLDQGMAEWVGRMPQLPVPAGSVSCALEQTSAMGRRAASLQQSALLLPCQQMKLCTPRLLHPVAWPASTSPSLSAV